MQQQVVHEGRERFLNDLACVQAVRQGQTEAFSLLVDRYQGMVYRVCLKMIKDPISAEDVTQDIFIKAYESLASFRGDAQFSTWLYTITVRKCLDWQRARSRNRVDLMTSEQEGERTFAESETPEDRFMRMERTEKVKEAVRALKEPYRTVVRQYYLEERSYQEISEQSGVPIKTIESQLYRARKMLKQKGEELDALRGNRG
ncbi:RNA polymerase sigma factor [Marinicrinis sediminis]|uniref:RNA polymerase sigma factor n=1 Tax=Marinicrinis sediminis TaxID=1652465 RepID=A0ABW5RAQ7_9BACL